MADTELVVGIDLGTTNSEIAAFVDGQVRVLGPAPGMLPSCVGITPAGDLLVGQEARRQQLLYPERTVRSIKRKMGTDYVVPMDGRPNLPEPVDLILIVDTYHHIGDREAYFRRLARSIKPGGKVAIIDFKPDSPEGPPKEFRFPLEKFKSEMGKAGYKLAAQHNLLPRQQFLIFEVAGPSSR